MIFRYFIGLTFDKVSSDKIDKLRRELGVRNLERLVPHITIIPPFNLNDEKLGRVLKVFEEAKTQIDGPIKTELGPLRSFSKNHHVVFLDIKSNLEAIKGVYKSFNRGVLTTETNRPFKPHVTVMRIRDVLKKQSVLESYSHVEFSAEISEVTLFQLSADNLCWKKYYSMPLGA